jgi:hypothetical protein
MRGVAFLVALCVAGPALAEFSSVRPMPRPVFEGRVAPAVPPATPRAEVAIVNVSAATSPIRSIRPPPRPDLGVVAAATSPRNPAKGLLGRLFGPKKVSAPQPAPQPAPKSGSRTAPSVAGSVCQDLAIRGTAIANIKGAQKGCGVKNPVRVTEVDGVKLSVPATLDCETAQALREWVTEKLQPAFGGSRVTQLQVAAHYACRGRNNKKGVRVSEHGRGKAIDISGFTLADGRQMSVLNHYKGGQGKAIRAAHKGACGIFGTTLGPGSDGYHENHLHFDTARYRGGPYCK